MISHPISLNPGAITRLLATVAIVLVLASIAGQVVAYKTELSQFNWLISLFNVDAEQNIPTFFSVFLLFVVTLLLFVIALLDRSRTTAHALYWTVLAIGFLTMAADEFISFHERLITPMRKLLGEGSLGFFYFAWVILGFALILVLAGFFLRFWLDLPANTRLTFFIAASIYIGGSIGLEMVGGRYAESHGLDNLTYSMITTVEESLEMAGLILFIWGLLVYIADIHKEVRFRFDGF